MSFSSTLLHARKSRANSEISELGAKDGHHRLDVVPNDGCPRSRSGERHGWLWRTALQTVPERPSVAAWALVYPTGWRRARGGSRGLSDIPYSWPYAAGDNSRRRVSPDSRVRGHSLVQCGTKHFTQRGPHDSWRPRGHNWQRWHCPGPPFLWGPTRIPERPHHVQIIEYILGFLGPGKDGEN
ncbi:hypothetical protein EVAR_34175_1 [Eumeta japonica]|uniref:Uncharacterized protein n=1 Tax=Eumeta variegata TaxID=151549 RepID=A0A4C1WKJ1_EUMVA|nr:hypothetical protein EVAR_34175_1 [Eumeta japonica]